MWQKYGKGCFGMELVKDFWAILMALGGLVVWFVRLESRATSNTKEIADVKAEMLKLEKRLEKQRTEDLANRERDWASMRSEMGEIKTDIRGLRVDFQQLLQSLRSNSNDSQ